jgi:hypothetical protein
VLNLITASVNRDPTGAPHALAQQASSQVDQKALTQGKKIGAAPKNALWLPLFRKGCQSQEIAKRLGACGSGQACHAISVAPLREFRRFTYANTGNV